MSGVLGSAKVVLTAGGVGSRKFLGCAAVAGPCTRPRSGVRFTELSGVRLRGDLGRCPRRVFFLGRGAVALPFPGLGGGVRPFLEAEGEATPSP